jgi:hypothetical protein
MPAIFTQDDGDSLRKIISEKFNDFKRREVVGKFPAFEKFD